MKDENKQLSIEDEELFDLDVAWRDVIEQQSERIEELKSALNEAKGWNWLDDDMPEHITERINKALLGERMTNLDRCKHCGSSDVEQMETEDKVAE